MTASHFALISAGVFFLAGLLAGAWKYLAIRASAEARAPIYVEFCHRASLLYAFASALLGELARRSAWPDRVNLVAIASLVGFFAVSVLSYVVHAALRDTDNQFARPHRLGPVTLPASAMVGFMATLIVVEVGGFLVVFTGFLAAG